MPEDYPKSPITVYGKGKLEAEKICLDGFAGSVIARHYAIMGAWLPLGLHFAAGNFIRDAMDGTTIVVQSDGRPVRSYLHTSDLVVWLMTVLLKGEAGKAYNIGSEEEISIGDLARLVSKQFVPAVPVRILGKPGMKTPPPRYVPSTARAREELGLVHIMPLQESLKRTIAWYERRTA